MLVQMQEEFTVLSESDIISGFTSEWIRFGADFTG